MRYQRSDLRSLIGRINTGDAELAREIRGVLRRKDRPSWAAEAGTALDRLGWDQPRVVTKGLRGGGAEEESIALRYGRPVIAVSGGQATLQFVDADSETWRLRLTQSADTLAPAIASIGRVEVTNHPSGFPYMGTGWVIDRDVVVTNRHVALTFADRSAGQFTFRLGFDRRSLIGVDLDFLEEIGGMAANEFLVREVLYIASDDEPDVAFLRLAPRPGADPPRPLAPLAEAIPPETMVAIVGYPSRDSRVPDQALMDRIFGGVYDKKRLAPGFASQPSPDRIIHDCTTLGGNSGSPLLDLATGKVCGLHHSGLFLKANNAVPASLVVDLLNRFRRGDLLVPPRVSDTNEGGTAMSKPSTGDSTRAASEVKVTVPLEITVRLGTPAVTAAIRATGGTPTLSTVPSPSDIREAVVEAKRQLGSRLDVVNIEAGWKFTNGWITDQRAVIVHVRGKRSMQELAQDGVAPLPTDVLGVPIDVRPAPLRLSLVATGIQEEVVDFSSDYETDSAVPLREIEAPMKVTVSMSPDAGWPVLQEFLSGTRKRLTVGMYDFTAPHIIDAIQAVTKPTRRKFSLVLQQGQDIGKGAKADDIPEEDTVSQLEKQLKSRFNFAWASVRFKGALFKSAYHIKVAVRDGQALWLSSGNWQSSNQPDHDPIKDGDTSPSLLTNHNRDWHAVVENEALAAVFEHYLKRDRTMALEHPRPEEGLGFEERMVWVSEDFFQSSQAELETPAQFFKPLTVERSIRIQPLLTPDNYAAHVLGFINSAMKAILFQNQSLKLAKDGSNPAHYQRLLDALLAKQQAGLDVRIIIRRIGDLEDTISRLKDFGFDTDRVRLQTNCHTKGIVIDGEAVMLGSQNWTGDGTGPNRDASVLLYDQSIAQYFTEAFEFDWRRAGKPNINESLPAPELSTGEESVPRPGMILMPLSRWLGEG